MAKPRQKKESEVAALTEKLRRMKTAVITTVFGLKVKDATELRTLLRKSGVEYVVAKKTLLRRALQAASLEHIDIGLISSSFSVAFSYGDEVAAARLLAQFKKTHEMVEFLGGIMEGIFIDGQQVSRLAQLPSRDELRGRLIGTIAAPLSGFVSVLSGNLRGLVRVLKAHEEQRAST